MLYALGEAPLIPTLEPPANPWATAPTVVATTVVEPPPEALIPAAAVSEARVVRGMVKLLAVGAGDAAITNVLL